MHNSETRKVKFKGVYCQYAPKLTAFATEYVIRREDAENIVQDVFAILWENWDTYGNHGNLMAFLFITVKNKCIDFIRRQAIADSWSTQQQEEYALTLRSNLYALDSLPDDVVNETNIQNRIDKAIASLPPRCREIFVKNKIEGMKQKDIARELGISVNTVESQMAIAYRILRDELRDLLPLLVFFLA